MSLLEKIVLTSLIVSIISGMITLILAAITTLPGRDTKIINHSGRFFVFVCMLSVPTFLISLFIWILTLENMKRLLIDI